MSKMRQMTNLVIKRGESGKEWTLELWPPPEGELFLLLRTRQNWRAKAGERRRKKRSGIQAKMTKRAHWPGFGKIDG